MFIKGRNFHTLYFIIQCHLRKISSEPIPTEYYTLWLLGLTALTLICSWPTDFPSICSANYLICKDWIKYDFIGINFTDINLHNIWLKVIYANWFPLFASTCQNLCKIVEILNLQKLNVLLWNSCRTHKTFTKWIC